MRTADEIVMAAPVETCFEVAADVERWPEILPHYRWVRFHRKESFGTGRVEMAAHRSFGPLPYPVWWVSEMEIDVDRPAVLYRHVDGITTGMEVVWAFEPAGEADTRVTLVHTWEAGPNWPLPRPVRALIADLIIGPVFIDHVAGRTLRGIARRSESLAADPGLAR